MKFGKVLATHDPEWSPHALAYKKLKKTLRNILSAAQSQEDLDAAEKLFEAELRAELGRVSQFLAEKHQELQQRTENLNKRATTLAESDVRHLAAQEASDISLMMVRLDQFTRLNGTAVAKILKKHDKMHRGALQLLPEYEKVVSQLYSPAYQNVLDTLNEMWLHMREGEGQPAAGAGAPAAAGADGKRVEPKAKPTEESQDFERMTRKYWVRPERVLELKAKILPHLELASVYGDSDTGGLVSSIYFDSPNLDLYHERMKREEGAIALRIRWYGDGRPKECYVERKTHHESWVDEASVKQRFSLKEENVEGFLNGSYTLAKRIEKMRKEAADAEKAGNPKAGKMKRAANDLETLSTEVQMAVLTRKLSPVVRTEYRRVAFQVPGDASVRISLDVGLCMLLERGRPNCEDPALRSSWCRGYNETRTFNPIASEVDWFPYGVLEVKLQGARPKWVEEIVDSDLVLEVHKFSKFMHGVSVLMNEQVKVLPWWWGMPNSEMADESLPKLASIRAQENAAARSSMGADPRRSPPPLPNTAQAKKDLAGRLTAPRSAQPAIVPPISAPTGSKNPTPNPEAAAAGVGAGVGAASPRSPAPPAAPARGAAPAAPAPPPPTKTAKPATPPPAQPKSLVETIRSKLPFGMGRPGPSEREKELAEMRKRIRIPEKIEPKTFLANERTFMNWLHFAVILMTVGGALVGLRTYTLSHGSSGNALYEPLSPYSPAVKAGISGIVFLVSAILVSLYATGMYHNRMRRISEKTAGSYGDRVGPSLLAALLLCLAVVNIYLYSTEFRPPCANYAGFLGGAALAPHGILTHPSNPSRLFVAGSSLAELDIDALRVRTYSIPDARDIAMGPLLDGGQAARLYVLQQRQVMGGPPRILELDLDSTEVTRNWTLEGVTSELAGGLAFVPQAGHPQGGYFLLSAYASAQVYKVELPLRDAAGPKAGRGGHAHAPRAAMAEAARAAAVWRATDGAMGRLAGLDAAPGGEGVYAMLESSLVLLDPATGAVRAEWPMLFRRYGGVHVAPGGSSLFVSTTRGELIRMPFSPEGGPQLCDGVL